jgi:glycosyltransferase involved in cell wall biosynthesis
MPIIEITIPVLNEAATIREQIGVLTRFLAGQPPPLRDARVILADNGSTDATPKLAEELSAVHPGLGYIRLEKRGVGGALRASWTASVADIIGYMDLDFSTDLHHLSDMARIFETEPDVAIVNGSRLLKSSRVMGRSPLRAVASRAFNGLVRAVFGTRFTDGMCGFKFARRHRILEMIERDIENEDWFFSTALLVFAENRGLTVREIPVRWADDPHSKVRIIPLSLSYLRSMLRLRARLRGLGLLRARSIA